MAFLNALKNLVFGKRDPVVAQKPADERPSSECAATSEDGARDAAVAEAIDPELKAANRRAPVRGSRTSKPTSEAPAVAVQALPVGGEATRPRSPAAPDSIDASTSAGLSAGPSRAPRTNMPAASASEEFRETWVSSPKKAAEPEPRDAGRAPPPGPEDKAPAFRATFKPAALERARRIAAQLRESPEEPSEAAVEPPVTKAAAKDASPTPPASSADGGSKPTFSSTPETELARSEGRTGLEALRTNEAVEEPATAAGPVGHAEPDRPLAGEERTNAVAGALASPSGAVDAVPERPLNLGGQNHDPLLTDLVRLNPTSVRLENAILNGETAGALPHKTVMAYVGDAESRARFLRCVANFGRLSADELDRLVAQAHRQLLDQQAGFKLPEGGELASAAAVRHAVLALFAGRDTDDVLSPFPLPARFQNALFMRGWLALPFSEFLSTFPQRCAQLLSQSNVGRGSVEAGRALVGQAIVAELTARGVEAAARDYLLAAVLDGRDLSQLERQVAAAGLLRCAPLDAGAAPADASEEPQRTRLPLETDSGLIVAVADLFGEAAVGDMIGPFIPPARLENGLRIHGYLEKPYRDMLLDFPELEREMLKLPNMGRTSLAAWRKIAGALLESRLGRLGLGRASIDEISALVIQGRPMSAQARRAAAAELDRSGAEPDAVEANVRAPEHLPPKPPDELLQPLLAALNERTQEVIRRRYGLNGRPRETLEQISQTYEVTRERIRQIEHKALRILRLQTQAELELSLKLYAEQAWCAMSDRPILTQAELPQRRRRLCGWFEIALDVAKLDLHDWLDDYAQRVPAGWLAPDVDLGRLEAARLAIRARSDDQRSPYALQSVRLDQSNLGLEDIRLAAELEGRRLFGDYVVSGYLGPRARRTVQIHALLAKARRPVEVVKALADYIARFPSDPCSARDLELVMQDHPRLFLEVQEGVWAALGRFGAAPSQAAHPEPRLEAETADPDATDEGDTPEEETVAEAIFAELRRSGPQRISILMERAPDFLPPGRSSYSVGPILLSHKDLFARPLPGVYALHDQVLDEARLMEAKPTYLFDERHVRNYVLARNAGEPFGAYALWTPAVEYLWCCWARRHADSSLLEALLSVADPDAWPEIEDRESWRALKAQRGRYALHVSPRDESYGLPELEHVLSASLLIREHRRLTWVSGNRAQFRRPADHTSAGLLALLVAVGALQDGAPHWQAAHDIGPELSVVLERLEDERVRLGVLHWQGEAGQALLAQARRFSPRDGWVTADRVERLVGASQPDPAEPQFPTATGAGDFLDQLLAEESQRHQAARLAGALAELGNEDGEAS